MHDMVFCVATFIMSGLFLVLFKVKHNVYLITALLHLAEADVHELNTNKNIS